MLALSDDDGLLLDHDGLRRRADAWAATLARRWGVRAQSRVAVLAYGRADVFVLGAACRAIGAALVPLSWRATQPEVAEIIRDCTPNVVLTDLQHADLARTLDAPTAFLADPQPGPIHHANGDVAQVLYTSGTTGKPKGVLISPRQLDFNARVTQRLCGLNPTDRVLGLLPLFHTGGLNALATPTLAAGGGVIVMRRFDASAAVARMDRDRITALIAVPTIYEQLLDAGLSRATAPHLRTLLVGGAQLAESLIARFRHAGLRLRQGYGLTEVGPNCFSLGDDGSVGRPVSGSEARLVDGELWLRGPHVTAGYLGRGPATDDEGWFHTGDLFRIDDLGNWRVAGRKKEMFISGGENVYPAEVELALAEHPAIVEVAVLGTPDDRWGEVGMAAVVARGTVDTDALGEWARARLAAFKVPRHWRFVDALPRTASGKVDRAALARALTP
jgi:fatty-acyl-CoA synthase